MPIQTSGTTVVTSVLAPHTNRGIEILSKW